MTALANGIHFGVLQDDYARAQRVNWSTLKEIGKSPAHYRHRLLTPREDTDSLKLGRAVHLAALEPELFLSRCAIWDGGRRAGKEWEKFKAANEGRELLKSEEYEHCIALQRAVRDNPHSGPLLANGHGEVTVFWDATAPATEGLDGWKIECKSRIDFDAVSALVDLKTCRDASPAGFGRAAWNYGMHIQAAFYRDAYEAAGGKRKPYLLIAVETEAPHVVQVYEIPEAHMELGRETYRGYLDRLALCRRESRWPGYADGVAELELPRWAAPSVDEDASGLGLEMGEAQ